MANKVKNTYGKFKFIGIVDGVSSDRFYKEIQFESGAIKREVSFGIKTSPTNKLFVKLEAWKPKDKVKFNKYLKETKERVEVEVDFEDRFGFKEEGFRPAFGTTIGLKRGEDGKLEDYNTLFQWDATTYLAENLADGMEVVIEGNVSVNGYTGKDGEYRQFTNYNITKIMTLKKPLDFESEDFKEENKVEQIFVFMGIEKTDNGEFELDTKLVFSDDVFNQTFTIINPKLARALKTNVKPYTAVKGLYRVMNVIDEDITDDIDDDDSWGEDDDLDNNSYNNYIKKNVLTKVYKNTLDKETYAKDVLESLITANEDFGEDDWDMDDDADDLPF